MEIDVAVDFRVVLFNQFYIEILSVWTAFHSYFYFTFIYNEYSIVKEIFPRFIVTFASSIFIQNPYNVNSS